MKNRDEGRGKEIEKSFNAHEEYVCTFGQASSVKRCVYLLPESISAG